MGLLLAAEMLIQTESHCFFIEKLVFIDLKRKSRTGQTQRHDDVARRPIQIQRNERDIHEGG